MNPLPRPIEIAQQLVKKVLHEGDFAIDATVGNGHDTLFLCKCVGVSGKVIGFDVQSEAIDATRRRLQEHGVDSACYELLLDSHASLRGRELEAVKAAMFNLGYLPGSNKSVITLPEVSLVALQATMDLLAPGGVITVMCYPGHEGGDEESQMVLDFSESLDRSVWQILRIDELDETSKRPFLVVISRR